jgi:hypothetical protein
LLKNILKETEVWMAGASILYGELRFARAGLPRRLKAWVRFINIHILLIIVIAI